MTRLDESQTAGENKDVVMCYNSNAALSERQDSTYQDFNEVSLGRSRRTDCEIWVVARPGMVKRSPSKSIKPKRSGGQVERICRS